MVSTRPGQEASPESSIDALVQASFAVTAVLSRIAAQHDVSLTLLRLMGILIDHEPRMAELADHLGLERSTMSGLINRAEKRGLVERRSDPGDARSSIVAMTAGSRKLVESVRAEVLDALAPLLMRLEPNQRVALTDSLRVIVESSRRSV